MKNACASQFCLDWLGETGSNRWQLDSKIPIRCLKNF